MVRKVLVVTDVLMICVMTWLSVGAIPWRRVEGKTSRGQVVEWLKRRSVNLSMGNMEEDPHVKDHTYNCNKAKCIF